MSILFLNVLEAVHGNDLSNHMSAYEENIKHHLIADI